MGIENCPIKKALESMSEDDDKKMQQEMLLQLHEQYAVNNNAKLESAVTLIVGLLAVIGAYGYVFLNINEVSYKPCIKPEFNLLDLVITAMAAIIVLAIMKHICMYQGFAQRRDQFIIYAIRFNYGLKIKEKYKNRIFPDNYHPYNKEGIEIYQGLFGEFIKIFTVIQIIVFVSTFILCSVCIEDILPTLIRLFALLGVALVCRWYSKRQQHKNSEKYNNLCNIYEKYKVEDNAKSKKNDKEECKVIKWLIKFIEFCY